MYKTDEGGILEKIGGKRGLDYYKYNIIITIIITIIIIIY